MLTFVALMRTHGLRSRSQELQEMFTFSVLLYFAFCGHHNGCKNGKTCLGSKEDYRTTLILDGTILWR